MSKYKISEILGRPDWISRLPQDVQDRLAPQPNGCVLFTGKRWGSGQPALYVGNGKSECAYRWIYRYINGTLPPVLRHICDNPLCCNPGHLLPGDYRSNNTDASRRGRIKRKLTNDEVQEIRWLLEHGVKQVDIAPYYAVTPQLVGQIKNKKRYHWLPSKPLKPKDFPGIG